MAAEASSRWQLPAEDTGGSGMALAEVQRVLGDITPLEHAASWDNVGLLVGTPQQRVR